MAAAAQNPMYLLDPTMAQNAAQIEYQRQLSQALLQQGLGTNLDTQSVGGVAIKRSPIEGLAKILQIYSGGQGMQQAAQQTGAMQQRYSDMLRNAFGLGQTGAPDDATASQQALGMGAQGGSVGPTVQNSQIRQQLMQPDQGSGGSGLTLPGMSGGQAMMAYSMNPEAYMKTYMSRFEPTTEQKNYAWAAGGQGPDLLRQKFAKDATQTFSPGQMIVGPDGAVSYAPDPHSGVQMVQTPAGPVAREVPGALFMRGAGSEADASGPAKFRPYAGYGPDGNPAPVTTDYNVATGQTQGGSHPGFAGNYSAIRQQIMQIKNPADRAAALAQLDAQAQGQTGAPGGAIYGAPAPGVAAFREGTAKASAQRVNDLIGSASESPNRVNVLDNIIRLSDSGVKTGPTQGFYNQLQGAVANAPLIGDIFKGSKDQATGAQELNKFLYQNALRNWQSAGGTGTDSQLEAYSHANPNDTMFPAALKSMAQYSKASELAIQAKANLAQRLGINDQQSEARFQSQWQNNFDPLAFHIKTMPPAEAKQRLDALTQPQRNELLRKIGQLKQWGVY